MKLSRSFLDDYVNTKNISNLDLAEKMTSIGNEYDSIKEIASGTNLVVGKVLSCEMHPDSDHLHVCVVDTADEERTIVCGAPNVKEGIKVIVALPGAVLPGGVIKKGLIRGVESNGMICSLAEIGLDTKYVSEEDKAGIHILPEDAQIGLDAKEYLGYDDVTIDFELTPNRSDLLNVIGMAYEVGAMLDEKVNLPEVQADKEIEDINDYLKLSVITDNCPLYLARMVKDIQIKESPKFIKKRLMASGIRPINNVVDISNYVMLEYGQPLHFFDYDELGNEIIVRMANDEENITTLDGNLRVLSKDDIVITNKQGPVCLAGVMGDLNTEITNNTKNVIIESAVFNPINIRKTSRRILMSEASMRFERGIDANRSYEAVNRACYLLEKYADATVISGMLVHDKVDKEEKVITISKEKIEKVLGLKITKEDIVNIFTRLGFSTLENDNVFTVTVPTRRLDISIKEDLIEEIGRIHGINNIVGKLPVEVTKPGKRDFMYQKEKEVKEKLISLGLKEVITYSLTSEELIHKYNYEDKTPFMLLRPMSEDKKYMRLSLIPSLYEVYKYNFSRNIRNINIFEISNTYFKEDDKVREDKKLSILIEGNYTETKWLNEETPSDFYTLKGIITTLFDYLGLHGRYDFVVDNLPSFLHNYQSALLTIDRNPVGFIGKLHPSIAKKDIYVLEVSLEKLFNIAVKPIKNKEVSKYPEIKKDVAFILDEDIKCSDVIKAIKKAATNLLINIEVFDLYYGDNIGEGKKSLAFALTFNSNDRTLTEEEVEKLFRNIIAKVEEEFNAQLRDK